jgi:hypothetical protein
MGKLLGFVIASVLAATLFICLRNPDFIHAVGLLRSVELSSDNADEDLEPVGVRTDLDEIDGPGWESGASTEDEWEVEYLDGQGNPFTPQGAAAHRASGPRIQTISRGEAVDVRRHVARSGRTIIEFTATW